jgi:DtxR family transcriptional regulator, Mn-dependent transcriptional regulator
MISKATEDYLKTIYKLGSATGEATVSTSALAEALDVSAPSATNMLKRLAELRLVDYHPYRGATLTAAGRKIALEVVRHHRLLECYLKEALGYGWDQVHEEAERLEHHVSEELEDRMDAVLGYPTVDPHGDPIPTREGAMAAPASLPLAVLPLHQAGVIGRVSDGDPAKLRYLAELGLVPGVAVTVLDAQPFNGPLRLRVGPDPDDADLLLGRELAGDIFIRTEERHDTDE